MKAPTAVSPPPALGADDRPRRRAKRISPGVRAAVEAALIETRWPYRVIAAETGVSEPTISVIARKLIAADRAPEWRIESSKQLLRLAKQNKCALDAISLLDRADRRAAIKACAAHLADLAAAYPSAAFLPIEPAERLALRRRPPMHVPARRAAAAPPSFAALCAESGGRK